MIKRLGRTICVKCSEIAWDTDGDKKLAKTLPQCCYINIEDYVEGDDLDDELADARELIIKQEQEINFQVQDRARLQRELDELKQAYEQRVEEINHLKTECTLLDDELRNASKKQSTY